MLFRTHATSPPSLSLSPLSASCVCSKKKVTFLHLADQRGWIIEPSRVPDSDWIGESDYVDNSVDLRLIKQETHVATLNSIGLSEYTVEAIEGAVIYAKDTWPPLKIESTLEHGERFLVRSRHTVNTRLRSAYVTCGLLGGVNISCPRSIKIFRRTGRFATFLELADGRGFVLSNARSAEAEPIVRFSSLRLDSVDEATGRSMLRWRYSVDENASVEVHATAHAAHTAEMQRLSVLSTNRDESELEAARVAIASLVGGSEVIVTEVDLRHPLLLGHIRIPAKSSGAARRRSLRRDGGEGDAAHYSGSRASGDDASTTTGWIALSHELLHLVDVHIEGDVNEDDSKGRAAEPQRILLSDTHNGEEDAGSGDTVINFTPAAGNPLARPACRPDAVREIELSDMAGVAMPDDEDQCSERNVVLTAPERQQKRTDAKVAARAKRIAERGERAHRKQQRTQNEEVLPKTKTARVARQKQKHADAKAARAKRIAERKVANAAAAAAAANAAAAAVEGASATKHEEPAARGAAVVANEDSEIY